MHSLEIYCSFEYESMDTFYDIREGAINLF